MSRWLRYGIVDAFTDVAYRGNPAAVVPLSAPAPEAWMRDVAREMNLSETAFVHPHGDHWSIRWFTPAVEAEICGHATLASAHLLREWGLADEGTITFSSRAGLLRASSERERIVLDFPSRLVEPHIVAVDLASTLGVEPVWTGRAAGDLFVRVDDANDVRGARLDARALTEAGYRAAVVTASSDDVRYDIVSRFFAPGAGVDEDPVTGSAHCMLGPYWAQELDRSTLRAYQASARGGEMELRVGAERVELVGGAVTVARGELRG